MEGEFGDIMAIVKIYLRSFIVVYMLIITFVLFFHFTCLPRLYYTSILANLQIVERIQVLLHLTIKNMPLLIICMNSLYIRQLIIRGKEKKIGYY